LNRLFTLDNQQFQLVHQEGRLTLDGYLYIVIVLDLGKLAFFAVEQIVGNLQRQLSAHLGCRPLGCGSMYLAEKGDRHVLDPFDLAAPGAVRTIEHTPLLKGLLDSLPRHFQHAELGDSSDRDPRLVALERILEKFFNLLDMLHLPHIDQVKNNEPAKVAQPQLPGRLFHCLKIRAEGGIFDIALPGGFT